MARGGFHEEEVVWPSSQASASRVQLFQQKKPQKASEATSAKMRRPRSAHSGRMWLSASMPTWPRFDWIQPAAMKVAPTSRKIDSSSCQSLGSLRK